MSDFWGRITVVFIVHNSVSVLPGALPEWIHSRWNREVLQSYPEINGTILRQVALLMGRGKSGSDDGIVAEMIAELDEKILDLLAEVYILRALNHRTEDTESAWALLGGQGQ